MRRYALLLGVGVLAAAAAAAGLSKPARASGPASLSQTQAVNVFVECVRNGDGRFDAKLGYENGNAVPVMVPVGPSNRFSPAPEDRGQPTVFLPGVHHDVLTAGAVPSQTVLVWALAFAGDTETATVIASFATKCSAAAQTPAPERGGKVPCVTGHARRRSRIARSE